METRGMKQDHADFESLLEEADELKQLPDDRLLVILKLLEKRIRELEFKIHEK